MLSRRDKLYVQPWEERRFHDHRSKVRSALPAIDDRAPPARAHVAVKLKKCQRETERARKIERDNYSLLQRLGAIMRTKRLDNCWDTPRYNSRHKVGMFYAEDTLGGRVAARASSTASEEASYAENVRCFACYQKRLHNPENTLYLGARQCLRQDEPSEALPFLEALRRFFKPL